LPRVLRFRASRCASEARRPPPPSPSRSHRVQADGTDSGPGVGCTSALDVIQWACGPFKAGGRLECSAGALTPPLQRDPGDLVRPGLAFPLVGPPDPGSPPVRCGSHRHRARRSGGERSSSKITRTRCHAARPSDAEVLGHGSGNLGLQARAPEPMATAGSLEAALRSSLREARLDVSEIDYISTHGGGGPSRIAVRRLPSRQCSAGRPTTSRPPRSGRAGGPRPGTGVAGRAPRALRSRCRCG